MDEITRWLEANLGLSPQVQSRILESLVVVLVLWVMRQIVLRTVVYRMSDDRRRYQWQKTLGYVFFTLVVLLVWPIWFRGFQSLATYLGLLSAGLAIALKDPITDLIGWGFILWRRSFEVGDRIQIGEYAGDVIDQRIFQFSLMEVGNWVDAEQSTGRVLHVPNGMIFTNVLANYTKGSRYIWNEIPVLVTFESDWEKAKQILREIARHHSEQLSEGAEESFKQASKQYLINYGTLTSTVYTSVKDSGVLLTMRYLCEPRKRRDSTEQVWESILRAFAPHPDIDFAYPTRRLYNNQVEGKQAAGSQSQVKEFSDS
ncbi:MAG: mechanosensitive ion channel [Anaerolineales bacterium]|jgi:small-conductance mechanosensitive channel